MKQSEIHERLVEWFRRSGAYVPPSKALGPLMEATYTVEEAELLMGLPLHLCDIEEISNAKDMEPGKIEAKLNELASRGLVYRTKVGGSYKYRLNPPRFVYLRSFFWPGRVDEHTAAVAPHATRYYLDGFGDHWKDVKTKGLRAIPIARTIKDPRGVLPFDAVLDVLQAQDRFAVANCACRMRKNADPELPDCTHETENCLHFGRLADYIVENKLGRAITLEESRDILTRAADEGLVHAVSNWQENVDTICNCCKCCCVYFQAFHVLKHESGMNTSNYEVHLTPETCKGCGLCVKRCPMEALELVSGPNAEKESAKVCSINPRLCIGCGVCANKCPTGSLSLERRSVIVDPPLTAEELKVRYGAEKSGDASSDRYTGDISSGEVIR